MEQKKINAKAGVIVFIVFVVGAVLLGLLLLNKGDGPVAGMILSNKPIPDAKAYQAVAEQPQDGVYQVVSNAYNQFQVDYQTTAPAERELVATVYFVECPAGSAFTGRWEKDGATLAESTAQMRTEPYGVLSFSLDPAQITAGDYSFVLSDEAGELLRQPFQVE